MISENFEKHLLFDKLEQLRQRLSESESKEKINLEKYHFFESVYQYLSSRIKLTIPILVQESEMNSLANEIEAALQQINAFLGNNNEGHLINATNNFNSLLTLIRNIPIPLDKNDFDFAKSITSFQKSLQTKYELLEKENVELKDQIEIFKASVEQSAIEIKKVFEAVESKQIEIQSLNSNFEKKFEFTQTQANAEFEKSKENFKNEFDNLKNALNNDTSVIVNNLNVKLEDAKKIVNIIGDVGVTGNYQKIANQHKRSADIFRSIAIILMLIFSSLIICTIINLNKEKSDNIKWEKYLLRILAFAALSYPATYAARESNKHRKLETINRTAELELAAINPFIENFPDAQKITLKENLAKNYFSNGKFKSSYDDKDKEEAFINANALDKLLKTISTLINK